MTTGVDLRPAVSRHVAQDLRHLLEHRQTPDMDLRVQSNNTTCEHLIVLQQETFTRTEWICAWKDM